MSASNSDRFSTRFGRTAILGGLAAMLAGQAGALLALHVGGPHQSAWLLTAPLAGAGAGNGLVIAPNQDFVPGSVPRREAGTAGAELITAQRIGAAIGIAAIGTVLFGSGSSSVGSGGSGGSGHLMPQYLHTAQGAILAGLGFILVAPGCAFALPRRLGKIALKKTPEDRHSLLKRTPEERQSLEDIATPLTAQDAGSAPSRAG